MAKIYISSTYEDLKEYRDAVYDALRRDRHDVIAMEDYVAQDQRPLQACLEDVASCDIYIGIFAWRYGFIPNDEKDNPDNLSITELEYKKAKEKRIPCLIFLLDDKMPWPLSFIDGTELSGANRDDINRLRKYLKNSYITSFFKNPDQLAGLVLNAVGKVLQIKNQQSATTAPVIATNSYLNNLPRIYISYAHEDIQHAYRIYYDLKQAGYNPWLDKEDILPGQNWRIEIQKSITQCKCFIALLSLSSIKRGRYVHTELKTAIDILKKLNQSQIFIIPIRLDQCKIPKDLENIHYEDMFPDWIKGLNKIFKSLQKILEHSNTNEKNKLNNDISQQPKIDKSQIVNKVKRMEQSLFEFMYKRFSMDDLKLLCFKYNIDYEDIPGTTLQGKIRELIQHIKRKNDIERFNNFLLLYLQQEGYDQTVTDEFVQLIRK